MAMSLGPAVFGKPAPPPGLGQPWQAQYYKGPSADFASGIEQSQLTREERIRFLQDGERVHQSPATHVKPVKSELAATFEPPLNRDTPWPKTTPAYVHLGRPFDKDVFDALKPRACEGSHVVRAAMTGSTRTPGFGRTLLESPDIKNWSAEVLATCTGLAPSNCETSRSFETEYVGVAQVAPSVTPASEAVTTLVVRNLSGRYSQADVLQIWPVDGSYDFMHVPYNLLQKRPLGYLFINFVTPELATAFMEKWHGRTLPNGGSKKSLDVAPADVQGWRANLELLKSRKMGQLEKAGFLPLVLKGRAHLDSKAILAELASQRNVKVKNAAKAPKESNVGMLDFHSLAQLGQKKLERSGDADSDAPTTATASECPNI